MENILELTSKVMLDDSLLKLCNVQLLTRDDVQRFIEKDDWLLSLKIDIEHNLAYEKL